MTDDWTQRPADRVVRRPRQEEMSPIRLTANTRKGKSSYLTSPLIIGCVLAAIILIGTMFLLLPFSNRDGHITPFMTALFTAASAVTLTGLEVRETASYWTLFGQVIILLLTFTGGLCFMTLATFLLLLIGQRVALADRFLVIESTAVNQLNGLFRLSLAVLIVTSLIQVVGFAALLARFLFLFSPAEAIWHAAFHSISAFNNAGFSQLRGPIGIQALRDDTIVLSIVSVLVILGGFGYLVIMDMVRFRRFSLFALNTKLVLVFSAIILCFGAVGILAFEYQNPQTLGPESVGIKISRAVFQSITSRTAGFDVLGVGDAGKPTNFFMTILMFIGGASASTAGGIKINTIAVILIAMASTVRGTNNPTAFGREITRQQMWRAMAIGVVASAFIFTMLWLLEITETGFEMIDVIFETFSAFGNVGLSTGITSELSVFGKIILIVVMFIGRVGPITLGLMMVRRAENEKYRYAQERVTIG